MFGCDWFISGGVGVGVGVCLIWSEGDDFGL